jgi:high-affinity iron transporter
LGGDEFIIILNNIEDERNVKNVVQNILNSFNEPFSICERIFSIGASIGISVGLLFYYLLISFKPKRSIIIGLILLLFVSSGMVSQASLLLIQADWLPGQLPLWNTSDFLSEKSVTGQLLYALIGYESTPTAIQASLYLLGFLLPISLVLIIRYISYKDTKYQMSES